MSHYFLHDDTLKDNEYLIKYTFKNTVFQLVSNNGVFSKNRLDEGSSIFIESLLTLDIKGKVLDLGCGYGPIGITLKYFLPEIEVYFSDVNDKCIELTTKNTKKYGIDANILLSNGFENIQDTFDYILFNPPIRIGKQAIFQIYDEAFNHLNQSGHFLIVIRKDKGAESHKKYLDSKFSKSSLINRDKGYYIYEFIK